ncbi:MAG: hypothetical protein ACI8QZ_003194, partial [Chlamydiales bacterium]
EFLVVDKFLGGNPEVVLWEGWTTPRETQSGSRPR